MENENLVTVAALRDAFQQWAGSFASAVSAAAQKYEYSLGQAISIAERDLRAAQVYAEAFQTSASWSASFASGARTAGNAGIASIMDQWAGRMAAQANTFLDPMIDAAAKIQTVTAEVNQSLSKISHDYPTLKAIGSVFDAYGLLTAATDGDWVLKCTEI